MATRATSVSANQKRAGKGLSPSANSFQRVAFVFLHQRPQHDHGRCQEIVANAPIIPATTLLTMTATISRTINVQKKLLFKARNGKVISREETLQLLLLKTIAEFEFGQFALDRRA